MTQMFSTGPVFIYIGLGPVEITLPPEPDLGGEFNLRAGGVGGAALRDLPRGKDADEKVRHLRVQTSPVFLGTCERVPLIRLEQKWYPFIRDDGGLSVPYELIYDSEEAWIYAEINRYNEPVLEVIQDRCFGLGRPPVLRGMDREEDIGTLANAEKVSYALWLVFPYARKLVMALGGMPANYVFPAVVAFGPEELSLGHRPRKNRLVWRALRYHDPNSGDFLLYAHDPFVALPPPI